jgi:hypothetical protein
MRRNFVVIPALLIALVGAGASAFAQPPRDNGLVYIYGTEALPPAILTFAPGNPSPLFVTEITENTSQPVYSATGDHSAFVTYGEAGQILRYGQLGQPFAEISAPAGWDFYAPTFSPDNARLAYSLVNWGEMRWQLALVEVATEAAIVFEGQIDLAASDATGPTTLPITPLGWRADNQALYIVGIVPDGYATPPYALDLSNLSYTGGAQNIPPQEVLLDAEAMNLPMQFRLSPAGTHLLFSYYDPARPITTPSDMMLPTNALGILDLASKAITFVPLEGEGELVLGVLGWGARSVATNGPSGANRYKNLPLRFGRRASANLAGVGARGGGDAAALYRYPLLCDHPRARCRQIRVQFIQYAAGGRGSPTTGAIGCVHGPIGLCGFLRHNSERPAKQRASQQ